MVGLLADLGIDDFHNPPVTAQNLNSLDSISIGTGGDELEKKAPPRYPLEFCPVVVYNPAFPFHHRRIPK
ncbi:hypothetical protein ACHHRT_08070 [Desulfurivibrio sp. D14AmB]|uniref:hypothetical protein n=1 Tax=Desulfurivibrio sp. D14AmB TaxID=3374370 RepID=UPI00376F2B71